MDWKERRMEGQNISPDSFCWECFSSSFWGVSSSVWPPEEKNLLRKVAQDVWSLIEKHAFPTQSGRLPWMMALTGLYHQKLEANSVNNCVCLKKKERINRSEGQHWNWLFLVTFLLQQQQWVPKPLCEYWRGTHCVSNRKWGMEAVC